MKSVTYMTTVRDVYDFLDRLAPFETQMEWDNSGLVLGGFAREVRRAAVCLDVPADLPDVDLIVSHHPVIFHPRRQFTNPMDPAVRLLRQDTAAIAFHTNYDTCAGGVNDILAARLGLADVTSLPSGVRIGTVPPTTVQDYAKFIGTALGTVTRYRAATSHKIHRIAVCGGAGCSYLPALTGKADVFVTGDAGHHDFLEAAWQGLSLVAAGHYHTEVIAMPPLHERLRGAFPAVAWEYIDEGGEELAFDSKSSAVSCRIGAGEQKEGVN